jgi:hypothetical protein
VNRWGSAVLLTLFFTACGESNEESGTGNTTDAAADVHTGGNAGAPGNGGHAGTIGDSGADVSLGGASTGGAAGNTPGGSGGSTAGTGGVVVDGCTPSPPELCNGKDDDCNGVIDDGYDLTSPETCGTCKKNCSLLPHTYNADCVPPPILDGTTPGTCTFDCESDYYDLNPAIPGCEYQCTWNPSGTITQDGDLGTCGADDDCDGKVDEDVNLCGPNNCGKCAKKCNLPHATQACTQSGDPTAPCGPTNTACTIAQCDPGWQNLDGAHANGCESPVADGG